MGVVLRQAWSKSQWTALIRYLTILTNVRHYHTSQTTFFSFRKTAHRCIVRVTQSNWVKMWFLCFPVLPGSAEVQVIWGGIVKRLLIVYFICNISAKKYQNPFMCLKVIASQKWDVFETRCRTVQPVATCRQSPYVHKPAIVELLLLIYGFKFRSAFLY